MTVASFDLNISPPKLLDLNEYPEENYGGGAATEGDVRVLRDLDLNVVPLQETEEEQSSLGASYSRGHIVQYACRNELPNYKRKQLYETLVWKCTSTNGRLTQEIVEEVAKSFSVSTRTVRRIWQFARQCFQQGNHIDVSKKRSNCSRKAVQVDLSLVRDIPLSKRVHWMIYQGI